MSTVTIISTVLSGAYTMYWVHPYIPYKFTWRYLILPGFNYIMKKDDARSIEQEMIEKDLEFYDIIKMTTDSNGTVTRYLVLKTVEEFEEITYEPGEPVWL
jgi:hypothetical protein